MTKELGGAVLSGRAYEMRSPVDFENLVVPEVQPTVRGPELIGLEKSPLAIPTLDTNPENVTSIRSDL